MIVIATSVITAIQRRLPGELARFSDGRDREDPGEQLQMKTPPTVVRPRKNSAKMPLALLLAGQIGHRSTSSRRDLVLAHP
jgi:hypothetical protein